MDREYRQQRDEHYTKLARGMVGLGIKMIWSDSNVKLRNEFRKAMFNKQEGKCKICKTTLTLRFALDHDHKSGVMRGVLCTKCNTALGVLEGYPEKMLIRMLKTNAKITIA